MAAKPDVLDLAIPKAKEFLRLERKLSALREELKLLLADGRTVEVEGEVFGMFPVVDRNWDMPKALKVLKRHKVKLEDHVTFPARAEKALLADPRLAELAECFVEKQYRRFGHKKSQQQQ